jgi:hypothetical protein
MSKKDKISSDQVKKMKEVVRRLGRLDDFEMKDFLEANGDKNLALVDPDAIVSAKKEKEDSKVSARSSAFMIHYATWKQTASADFMAACADYLVGNPPPLSVLKSDATLEQIQANLENMSYNLTAADTLALHTFYLLLDQWIIFEEKVKQQQFEGNDEQQATARNTALITMAEKMGKSVEYLHRMKRVHELIKNYPVLKFSGASRDLLFQFRADFTAHVQSSVAASDKAFWQQSSEDPIYIKNLEIMGALKSHIPAAIARKENKKTTVDAPAPSDPQRKKKPAAAAAPSDPQRKKKPAAAPAAQLLDLATGVIGARVDLTKIQKDIDVLAAEEMQDDEPDNIEAPDHHHEVLFDENYYDEDSSQR